MYSEIGSRMKQLRKSAKMSQAAIAEKTQNTQAAIAKIESGTMSPSLRILLRYADYFDVSMDYLCCRTEHPEGKLYEYRPKVDVSSDEMKRFIEMCFDPGSPVAEKMKQTLYAMVEESKE